MKKKKKIYGILLTACFLLAITVILQYLPLIRPDETAFLKLSAIIQHNILGNDPKPFRDSVIFINTSRDLALVSDTDRAHRYGKKVITDRKKLTAFFHLLNQHTGSYRFLLCDLIIDYPAPDDTLLKPEMQKLRDAIFAADNSTGRPALPLYSHSFGTVDYSVQHGSFTKMALVTGDSLLSLPTRMYEMTTKVHVGRGLLTTLDRQPAFNDLIPIFYYRKVDLENADLYHDLDDLLQADEITFNEYLRGKYIIMGDFESDLHGTYFGDIPGPLIHWDVYLTLLKKPPIIRPLWLAFTWCYFLILSYFIFNQLKKQPWITRQEKLPFIGKLLKKYISFLGAMVLLSLFSLFLFNIFISLFYVATFITAISVILENNRTLRSKLLGLITGNE